MSEEIDILDKLIFDIDAGKYEPDDSLPSENELAQLYKVPRMTARKVYKLLQERDYIYSIQGKGSFVKNRRKQIPLVLSGEISFSDKMKELQFDYHSKNIGCELIPYQRPVFQALGVEPNNGNVFKISRLRYVDGSPIALHISYVREDLFPDISLEGSSITSMFAYYHNKGYSTFESSSSRLSVVFPTRSERALLQCSSLVPLLSIESDCLDSLTGHVLEVTKILYRSDTFTYEI